METQSIAKVFDAFERREEQETMIEESGTIV
jgi:hypothetical protein